MAMKLSEDVKQRAEQIAKEKNWEVLDPGSVMDWHGKLWVAAVDKATDGLVWLALD